MEKKRRSRKKTTRNQYGRKFLIKSLLATAGGVLLLFFTFYCAVLFGLFGKLPDKTSLEKIKNKTSTEVYSADSVLIGRFYLQKRTRAGYDDISQNVINALIATEDARFYEHNGVDYRSLARVFFKTFLLLDRSSGGGSTISQQLVKNLFPRKNFGVFTIPANKLKEMILAQRLESIYSKKELLTLYLNTVPFGDNVFGIEMAAKRFFNKNAKNLNIAEAAVLVGMLKANYTYNPRLFPENSRERRNIVLQQMTHYGYLEPAVYKKLRNEPVVLKYTKTNHTSGIATYFRAHLRKELEKWCENNKNPDGSSYNIYTDGLKVYTTINASMQRSAEEAMTEHMAELQAMFDGHWTEEDWKNSKAIVLRALKRSGRYTSLKKQGLEESHILEELQKAVPMKIFKWSGEAEVKLSPIDSVKHYLSILQTGILAMDPQNGDIKAWVGGINNTYFKFDHVNTDTKRQVGSTFKPFVYAAALEDGFNPCKFISAEKITYTNLSDWSPGNSVQTEYDKKYTFKGALAHSVNTVTVRILEHVGIDKTIALVKNAGIHSELPEVASIALGTANISLMEMVAAYAVFANGGYAVSPRFVTSITDQTGKQLAVYKNDQERQRVISEETAMIMNTFLQEVVDNGTASRYRWKYGLKNELAGKTGTTQANADGWFIGYNPKIVVGTWVGADNPAVHFNTTKLGQGANTALPIVAKLFSKMQSDKKLGNYASASFPEISNRIRRKIDCDPEKEDKQFMEWLFGSKKKEEAKTATFGEEENKEKNIFTKIGNLFKKK